MTKLNDHLRRARRLALAALWIFAAAAAASAGPIAPLKDFSGSPEPAKPTPPAASAAKSHSPGALSRLASDPKMRVSALSSQPLAGLLIGLDAGAGGEAPVSRTSAKRLDPWTRTLEAEANRRVAQILQAYLEHAGAKAVPLFTMPNATPAQRLARAKEAGVDFVISVHHSYSADPNENATAAYFSPQSNPAIESLARRINEALGASLGLPATGALTGTHTLLQDPGAPTALILCSLISNPDEFLHVMEGSYNRREAEAIMRGVVNFAREQCGFMKRENRGLELASAPEWRRFRRTSPPREALPPVAPPADVAVAQAPQPTLPPPPAETPPPFKSPLPTPPAETPPPVGSPLPTPGNEPGLASMPPMPSLTSGASVPPTGLVPLANPPERLLPEPTPIADTTFAPPPVAASGEPVASDMPAIEPMGLEPLPDAEAPGSTPDEMRGILKIASQGQTPEISGAAPLIAPVAEGAIPAAGAPDDAGQRALPFDPPFPNPVRAALDQTWLFGEQHETGALKRGVSFQAPAGTPVHAVADGVVVDANYGAQAAPPLPYPRSVLLEHASKIGGQTVYSMYGQMAEVAVTKGQKVSAGTVLGTTGAPYDLLTDARDTELELQIWIGGKSSENAVNPELYLQPISPSTGIIAGQLVDAEMRSLASYRIDGARKSKEVLGDKLEADKVYSLTYSAGINAAPQWEENFVIGDVPPGRYELRFVPGALVRTVEVRSGEAAYVSVQGR